MKEVNNKQKKLFIVGLATFIILIVGATYAYFQVGISNLFGTSTINATADSIGSVILTGNNATLSMNLTAVDMMQGNSNINYYATENGKSIDVSDKETVVATATVSPNTDTNYYHCTYTLEVSQSYSGDKNMYRIFKGLDQVNNQTYTASDNELILIVNGTNYDLNSNTLTKEIPGEFYIKGDQEVEITAGLQLVNRVDKNQTLLAGSGVNLSIGVKSGTFNCTAEEEPQEVITYWTYEGEYVNVSTAHKISDYRNLNVYKRTYDNRIYTYANESACTTAVVDSETCSEVLQPHFIKGTDTPNTIATEDLYRYEEYVDGNLDFLDEGPYPLSVCEEWEWEGDSQTYGTCVKTVDEGDTYTKHEYEVCSNYGNRLICMKETDWENSETLRSQFETAGLTCAYFNNDTSEYVGTTKPEDGYLNCSDEDPTNVEFLGTFACYVTSNGDAGCGVLSEFSCYDSGDGDTICDINYESCYVGGGGYPECYGL